VRGDEPGPLFVPVNKGGKVQVGHGVSDEALAQMLEKGRAQAGVKSLTGHDFRRTFAGNLLDNGNDLVTVQKLMADALPGLTDNSR
jgi:site-specific recombinase XerD